MRSVLFLCFAFIVSSLAPKVQASDVLADLEHRPGFIDLYVDKTENKILAKLPEADEDGLSLRLIHTARLRAGLGSNPVGLDRGWGDSGKIVAFRQYGNKLIIEAENMTYRASPDNPLEQRAVRESFATSFLASAEILDESDGLIVDLTPFLTSDILGLVQYLKDKA